MRDKLLPDGTMHRHTAPEMEDLRQEFALWFFNPYREGTVKEWALAHHVSDRWAVKIKTEPAFIAKMEEFRKTYREEGDEALRNLIRFSHSQEPRVALPAIKILVEVMGYNAPAKIELSARGMSLMDYLQHIGQAAMKGYSEITGEQGIPAIASGVQEGEFSEIAVDPWETADTDRMN